MTGKTATPLPPPGLLRPGLAGSIGWLALAQSLSLILSIGSSMVLARLLRPQDYAVMASIAPVIGAMQTAQTLGLASAIIRAERLDKHQIDAIFWLVLCLSLLLATLVAFCGPVLAHWLTGLRLDREYAFMSLALVTAGLSCVPSAMLSRSLHFRIVALNSMIAGALGVVVTVLLAASLRNHWALLVAPVLVPLISAMLAAARLRWLPGWPRQVAGLSALLDFGLKLWATNLLTFVSRNADNLIVAGTSTPHELGIYDRSYRVLIYPLTQAVTPLGQVLVPTLTRTITDPDLYRLQYWRVTGLLMLAMFPALVVVTAFPTTLIGVVLGPAWLEAGPLFGWFAGAAMVELTLSTFNWLMTSQGRGNDMLRTGLVNALVALASFAIGIAWGILGVAVAFALGRLCLCLPHGFWRAGREGPLGHGEMARLLAPHTVALGATFMLIWAVRQLFGNPLWPMLLTSLGASYLVYLLLLLAFPATRRILAGLWQPR